MRSLARAIATVVYAAILAVVIALFGQGIWSALIVANLRTTPAVPWAIAVRRRSSGRCGVTWAAVGAAH